MLRIARPNSNHNAGYLSFNPTATAADAGNLYFGTGDSGGGGDPLGLAQMPGNVYGAIIRINPLLPASTDPNRSANGQYSIPADNPYVTHPTFLKEKYLMGFRNPQRFTWDGANAHMLIADIGQNHVEEIDLGQAGANYGWNAREGSYVFNRDGSIGANVRTDAATTGYTYPIAEYMHYGSIGNAITTGPAYRGTIIPALAGRLLFSDFVTGTPYTLDADNLPDGGSDAITELRLRVNGTELSFLSIIQQVNAAATRADLRYGTDAVENVYFLDKQDGVIRRVVTTPVTGLPTVTIAAQAAKLAEDAGKDKIIVTRTGDTSSVLTVVYAAKGSARSGVNYKALSGSVTIPAGSSTAIIKAKLVDDHVRDGTLVLKVTIQPSTSYTVGSPDRAKIKILNVD